VVRQRRERRNLKQGTPHCGSCSLTEYFFHMRQRGRRLDLNAVEYTMLLTFALLRG